MRPAVLTTGALLLALSLSAPANAITLGPELLTNGSFEDPDVATGTFALFAGIPGWTVFPPGAPPIEIQDNVAGAPYDGDQFVELDSTGNTLIFQFVDTVPGHLYLLQFAYSPRPFVGAGDNAVSVGYGLGPADDLFTLDGAGGATTSWSVYSFYIVADSFDEAVFFEGLGTSNSFGGYIDAVSFKEVVPEPSSVGLLGLGLLGLGAAVRRRAFTTSRRKP